MKKYLIFDLDWTLIKSNQIWLKNAIHIIKKYDKDYEEKARYIFTTTMWMNLYDQVEIILEDKSLNKNKIKEIGDEIYKRIRKKEKKVEFFNNVPKTIKKVSKKYKLFLSTWNSTQFALDILKQGWINDCFELVYWSDKVKKWKQHLKIFKNYTNDKDFYNNSLYFWDWDMDKIFANEAKIDFVRIWAFEEKWNDVLDSVENIEDILKKYK